MVTNNIQYSQRKQVWLQEPFTGTFGKMLKDKHVNELITGKQVIYYKANFQ